MLTYYIIDYFNETLENQDYIKFKIIFCKFSTTIDIANIVCIINDNLKIYKYLIIKCICLYYKFTNLNN